MTKFKKIQSYFQGKELAVKESNYTVFTVMNVYCNSKNSFTFYILHNNLLDYTFINVDFYIENILNLYFEIAPAQHFIHFYKTNPEMVLKNKTIYKNEIIYY